MSKNRFQDALSELGERTAHMAISDEEYGRAVRTARELVDAKDVPLTKNTYQVLPAVAGAMAIGLQDYSHDALARLVHATPQESWELLPLSFQEMLNELWLEEGGLAFLGKLGIAVVSEGFSYP